MTLQLAVKITGDASSLVQSGAQGTAAVKGVGAAAAVAGAQASAASAELGKVAGGMNAVTLAMTTAERAQVSATALANGQAVAISKVTAEMAALGRASDAAQRSIAETMARGTAPRPTSGMPLAQPELPSPAPTVPRPSVPPANENARPATAASGFRPDQWKNLGFQANDIATSLASGIPVTQVFAQQAGQVAQVLGDAPGGIAGGLKIVASRAMEVLTPVRLLTAGFVGAGAAVAYLGVTWARSQDEIKTGLMGIGAQSRATVADINRIAETAAGGGKLTRGDARGVAAAVASTGKVDVSNIPDIVDLAPGYAKLLGKDLKDAGSDLARIFADPVKGAAELNDRMGGLDASTQAYIRTLVDQNNRQEAVRAIVRTFGTDIRAAADNTSAWATAWDVVSDAAEATGRVVAKQFTSGTTKEQLAAAKAELAAAQRAATTGLVIGGGPDLAQDRARRNIAARQAEVDRLEKRDARETAAPGKLASAELSREAEARVRVLQPEVDQLEKLNSSILLLQKTQGDADAMAGLSAASRNQITTALDAARGGVETFMSAQDKARASEALTIRSIEARTDAEKAAIAAERERLNLSGQSVGADDRRQRIEGARLAVLAQSTRDSEDRLRSSTATLASAGMLSYPRQVAELDEKYRPILAADPGNANNQRAKAAERQAIDKEAIGGPLRDANRSIAEQVAGLKLQQDAFGASTDAAARMAAAQQLVNQYNAAGVPITADLKRGIDAYAASAGKEAAAREELVRKQRAVIGALDDFRSGTRSGLTGVFSDVAQGKSPLDGITSSLNSMASRVFDRTVSTPLTDGLLGQEGKPGGGLLGDTLGSLFGKQQGLSKADITAGIVNLTGPVSGIPGLGATAANGNVPSAASVVAGLGGSGSAEAAKKILSGLSGSKTDVAAYVQQAAAQRGIDPNVALRVINQESGFNASATNLTSKEQSYGVMQLNTQGGLGVDAMKAGIDVRDPSTWRQQVDFGLDTVKKDGWRQWYGARDIGVSRWEGVGQGGPAAAAANPAATAMPAVQNLDASLQSFNTSATTASQGLTGLTSNLTALPAPLAQTSQGLTQVGSSLGSGGGGGLLGALSSLFGGGAGAGASAATVAAAGGGHIRGPGTSTSDSIPAWLSDGEFVVNAAATKRALPVLHAINDGKMPAFAEGGLVGMAVPPAARREEQERQATATAQAQPAGGMEVHYHDNVGVKMDTKTTRNERGQPRLDVMIDNAVADALTRPGSRTGKAMSSGYGLQRSLTRRSS